MKSFSDAAKALASEGDKPRRLTLVAQLGPNATTVVARMVREGLVEMHFTAEGPAVDEGDISAYAAAGWDFDPSA